MTEEDCVFCKIVKQEIDAHRIYEDSKMLAFLDINPVNSGHVLLITKAHHEKITDVPDDLLGEVFVKSKELMKKIKKAMGADYVVLSVVGEEVDHFHIHLVPRYNDDGLKDFWPTKKYSEGEAEEVVKKILDHLA